MAHVTCPSSWVSPSEMNGMLLCTEGSLLSGLPEEGSQHPAWSISSDAGRESRMAVMSSSGTSTDTQTFQGGMLDSPGSVGPPLYWSPPLACQGPFLPTSHPSGLPPSHPGQSMQH